MSGIWKVNRCINCGCEFKINTRTEDFRMCKNCRDHANRVSGALGTFFHGSLDHELIRKTARRSFKTDEFPSEQSLLTGVAGYHIRTRNGSGNGK